MPETNRPLKVFLSYASQDKLLVRELSRRLVGEGWIDTWQDEKNLLPGQDWRVKIEEAVEEADVVIIVLSQHSVSKEGHVQKELRYAREIALEKPEDAIFLIPLRLDDCEVPRGLRFYQWVDYFDGKKDVSYKALTASLKLRYEQKLKVEEAQRLREEKIERELAEKLASEKAEKEAIARAQLKEVEKERLRNAAHKKEREAADFAEKERKEKELREKQAREAEEKAKRKTEKNKEKPVAVKPKVTGVTAYWFGGFIVLILGIIFLSSLNNPTSNPQPTPKNTQTEAIATFAQDTVEPSVTKSPKLTSPPANTLTPTPLLTEIIDVKGVPMVLVPEGEFVMGSDSGNFDEMPIHNVYLNAYLIDVDEVSAPDYEECVSSRVCSLPKEYSGYFYYRTPQGPIVNITWYDAVDFCNWRDARLPTEAEWEKAARGTDQRIYPWGDELGEVGELAGRADYSDYAVFGGAWSFSSFTKEKGVSPYGAYNMAGNVWEWVADRYDKNYYSYSDYENPQGPESGGLRVVRGGSFRDQAFSIRTTYRYKLDPTLQEYSVGFRCAKDATP